MRHILEDLENALIKLHQVDEMYKHNEDYDNAVIQLMETMRALEVFDKEVDRITEEYDEAFGARFPSKSKEFENYGDKHGK